MQLLGKLREVSKSLSSLGASFDASLPAPLNSCLLYTSDAADERSSVDLGGRRIIKKKTTDDLGQARLHISRTTTEYERDTILK